MKVSKIKLLRSICISLMISSVMLISTSVSVSATSISNNQNISVQNLVTSIKADKASNADEIDELFNYANEGNQEAIQQIKSFDCLNGKVVSEYAKNIILAPNTSKTIAFDDGSKVVFTNETRPVTATELLGLKMATMSSLSLTKVTPMSEFPTDPQVTNCTEKLFLGTKYLGYQGGSAYWYDVGRSDCHIISTAPDIFGPLLSITASSSRTLENDITDSTYQVNAQFTAVQYGIVIGSVSGDDIIFVDTGGFCGFVYDGLTNISG